MRFEGTPSPPHTHTHISTPVAYQAAPLDPRLRNSSLPPPHPPQPHKRDLPLSSHDGGAADPRSLTRGKRGKLEMAQIGGGWARCHIGGVQGEETLRAEREGTRDPRPLRPEAPRANPQRSLLLAPRLRLPQVRSAANSLQRTVRAPGTLGTKLPQPHPPPGTRCLLPLGSEAGMEKLWRG